MELPPSAVPTTARITSLNVMIPTAVILPPNSNVGVPPISGFPTSGLHQIPGTSQSSIPGTSLPSISGFSTSGLPQIPGSNIGYPQILGTGLPPISGTGLPLIPGTSGLPQIPGTNGGRPSIPGLPPIPGAGYIPMPSGGLSLPSIAYEDDMSPLPWLSVNHRVRGNAAGTNDDTYAPLTCTWHDNLVRIACIGEGSCFIHALLKGFHREYQENNSARFRLSMAANLRRDLAMLLMHENPNFEGRTYWETISGSRFPRMVMNQILDESLVAVLERDYSMAGLQRLFNSTRDLGDEIYEFVSEVLNIDVYIFTATRQDVTYLSSTRQFGVQRDAIMIVGNTFPH